MSDEVKCPKCSSTQLSVNKKGFSGKKAVAGAVLTGGIGLLAGTIGSNKIVITCLNCGIQFRPGEGNKQPMSPPQQSKTTGTPIDYEKRRKTNKVIAKVFAPLFGILGLLFILSKLYVGAGIMLFIGVVCLLMAFKTD